MRAAPWIQGDPSARFARHRVRADPLRLILARNARRRSRRAGPVLGSVVFLPSRPRRGPRLRWGFRGRAALVGCLSGTARVCRALGFWRLGAWRRFVSRCLLGVRAKRARHDRWTRCCRSRCFVDSLLRGPTSCRSSGARCHRRRIRSSTPPLRYTSSFAADERAITCRGEPPGSHHRSWLHTCERSVGAKRVVSLGRATRGFRLPATSAPRQKRPAE